MKGTTTTVDDGGSGSGTGILSRNEKAGVTFTDTDTDIDRATYMHARYLSMLCYVILYYVDERTKRFFSVAWRSNHGSLPLPLQHAEGNTCPLKMTTSCLNYYQISLPNPLPRDGIPYHTIPYILGVPMNE